MFAFERGLLILNQLVPKRGSVMEIQYIDDIVPITASDTSCSRTDTTEMYKSNVNFNIHWFATRGSYVYRIYVLITRISQKLSYTIRVF